MRCSQSFANGQWLQVKTTSVPDLPVTSAIDSILPSTFFILVFAASGALLPSASPPLLSAAHAPAAPATIASGDQTCELHRSLLLRLVSSVLLLSSRPDDAGAQIVICHQPVPRLAAGPPPVEQERGGQRPFQSGSRPSMNAMSSPRLMNAEPSKRSPAQHAGHLRRADPRRRPRPGPCARPAPGARDRSARGPASPRGTARTRWPTR